MLDARKVSAKLAEGARARQSQPTAGAAFSNLGILKPSTNIENPEFAPERSGGDKLRFFVLALVVGLMAVSFKNKVLIPWINELTSPENGRTWFGLAGNVFFGYFVFVGIPSVSALFTSVLMWRGYKILKSNQVPPPGERVFRRTIIRRGRIATISGYAHFLPTVLLLATAIWGFWQAENLLHIIANKRV